MNSFLKVIYSWTSDINVTLKMNDLLNIIHVHGFQNLAAETFLETNPVRYPITWLMRRNSNRLRTTFLSCYLSLPNTNGASLGTPETPSIPMKATLI